MNQLLHRLPVVVAIEVLDDLGARDILNSIRQVRLRCVEDTFGGLPRIAPMDFQIDVHETIGVVAEGEGFCVRFDPCLLGGS